MDRDGIRVCRHCLDDQGKTAAILRHTLRRRYRLKTKENLERLATRVTRVQRCFDFLSADTYESMYPPGASIVDADLKSRLPLATTDDDNHTDTRLIDPVYVDVYYIGARGVQPAWQSEPPTASLEGLASSHPAGLCAVGKIAIEYHTSQPATHEFAARTCTKFRTVRSNRKTTARVKQ